MKRSTFVILVLIAAIALMLARSNRGQSLLNTLNRQLEASPEPSSSAGRDGNPPAAGTPERFQISGRIVQHLHDGHIIVSGTLTGIGKTGGSPGDYSVVGRSDADLSADGAPINCEASEAGTYQFLGKEGFTRTVRNFRHADQSPRRSAGWRVDVGWEPAGSPGISLRGRGLS